MAGCQRFELYRTPGQCPYWMGHKAIKKRFNGDLFFEKWVNLPQSAYRLYWRQHPEEFAAANNLSERVRAKGLAYRQASFEKLQQADEALFARMDTEAENSEWLTGCPTCGFDNCQDPDCIDENC